MFAVEVCAAVRRFMLTDGNSRREAARFFGPSRETALKICGFSLPPGYTRTAPVTKPKLGALLPVIDAILADDLTAPVKQRHTAKRIFERLRDEHGFAGGYTVVKDHVRIRRARGRETFVPLAHPPGHGQVDFGEAVAVIGGVRQKIHFFCMDLAQSDACFVNAYPRDTTEAFLDGHVSSFALFGGVPLSMSPARADTLSDPNPLFQSNGCKTMSEPGVESGAFSKSGQEALLHQREPLSRPQNPTTVDQGT